ncbi:MAG TPA: hypothetical protein PK795_01030 [Bacillota bacterium]|nr:hypothetical protein [Bacillota bacterium]
MKRSLFGYNIKETDNLFNSMQNHIDVLTGKITNLNAELAAKSNAAAISAEAERKIAELQEKINLLEKENNALKKDLSAARSKIEHQAEFGTASKKTTEEQAAENNKKIENIGKIYLTAYEDAERIRNNAVEEANEYLRKFEEVKKELKQKMTAVLEEIRKQQSMMEDTLNETVQIIVKALGEFSVQSDRMLDAIEKLESNVAASENMAGIEK